jgi:predicted Zn finger-like uncharacterized protein
MRLICPNCDAQYEVVDDVIPTDGRDVQCSNCGQTWFQDHPDHIPDEGPEDTEQPADLVEPDDTPAEDEERAETVPPRRELDTSVADILRQEAELEAQARAGDALESQPELGLQEGDADSDRRAREAQERMAKIRGEEPAERAVSEEAATAAALGSRRDLLPDIEEINSTLRSSSDRQSGASGPSGDTHATQAQAAPSKSGFRRGFSLMILLAIILITIYVMAPEIAKAIPQVDPYLSSYVAKVDSARAWLDGHVTSLLTWLDAVAADQEG